MIDKRKPTDEIERRLEEIKKNRLEQGYKAMWTTPVCHDYARKIKEILEKLGYKASIPAVTEIALGDLWRTLDQLYNGNMNNPAGGAR